MNSDDPNAFNPALEAKIAAAMDPIATKIQRLQEHLAAFVEADNFNRRHFAATANRLYRETQQQYDASSDSK